jgi:hypothetical protein
LQSQGHRRCGVDGLVTVWDNAFSSSPLPRRVAAQTLFESFHEPHQPPLPLTPAAHPFRIPTHGLRLYSTRDAGSSTNGEWYWCGVGSSDSCVAWLGYGKAYPRAGQDLE